jgi:hypothetical protein
MKERKREGESSPKSNPNFYETLKTKNAKSFVREVSRALLLLVLLLITIDS